MSRIVYLLHFTKPYKHAAHYLGSTDCLWDRLRLHHAGQGARLTQVVKDAGLSFVCARTWEGSRHDERRRKGRSLRPLCPICAGKLSLDYCRWRRRRSDPTAFHEGGDVVPVRHRSGGRHALPIRGGA